MSDEKPPKKPRKKAGQAQAEGFQLMEPYRALQRVEEARMKFERAQEELQRATLEAHRAVADPPKIYFFGGGAAPVASELAKVFGENLRLARLSLRMKQEDLSRLSGVGVKSISQIENGANVTLATVERLARHVQSTPAELLTPRQSPKPPR
jgi:DNA-binding XRE family transcriptional regulator